MNISIKKARKRSIKASDQVLQEVRNQKNTKTNRRRSGSDTLTMGKGSKDRQLKKQKAATAVEAADKNAEAAGKGSATESVNTAPKTKKPRANTTTKHALPNPGARKPKRRSRNDDEEDEQPPAMARHSSSEYEHDSNDEDGEELDLAVNNRPKRKKPKLSDTKTRPSDRKSGSDAVETRVVATKELSKEQLLAKLQAVEARLACNSGRAARGGKKKPLPSAANPDSMNIVQKHTSKMGKQHLWQKTKVFKGEQYLDKATKMVMVKCKPREFENLIGAALEAAKLAWVQDEANVNIVRTSVNYQRNYVGNEIRDHYCNHVFQKGKAHEWPNPEQMHMVVMRIGMNEGDKDRELLLEMAVKVWDILLVKVAGMEYWCV